jgi:hypothetical protein
MFGLAAGCIVSHGHEGVGLGLDLAYAVDSLELLEELLLGRKLGLLPLAEGINIERRHHLEIQAAAANHALHTLDALHFLHLRAPSCLILGQKLYGIEW